MNAKGSMVTEIVIWLAIIMVVLISITWLVSNFSFERPKFEKIENDIARAQIMLNEGCNSYSYNYKFNPATEDGALTLKDTNLCIKSLEFQRCRQIVCRAAGNREIDLSEITYVGIRKTGESVDVYAE